MPARSSRCSGRPCRTSGCCPMPIFRGDGNYPRARATGRPDRTGLDAGQPRRVRVERIGAAGDSDCRPGGLEPTTADQRSGVVREPGGIAGRQFHRVSAVQDRRRRRLAHGARWLGCTAAHADRHRVGPVAGGDGRSVYFYSPASGVPLAYRIPSDGGDPVKLSDTYFRPIAVSPDGQRLLGYGWDVSARRPALATMPPDGGQVTLIADVPASLATPPDGRSVTYADLRDGTPAIITIRIAGGPAKIIPASTTRCSASPGRPPAIPRSPRYRCDRRRADRAGGQDSLSAAIGSIASARREGT